MLALTLCTRELRGGVRGFGVFLGCLFLGTLAISAVGSLGQALEQGLARDAKTILGADVSVALTSRVATEQEEDFLHSLGTVSQTLDTRTMAHSVLSSEHEASAGVSGPRSALVEVKGVDSLYPLYGELVLDRPGNLHAFLADHQGLPGAVVDQDVLTRLHLDVGAVLGLGETKAQVRAVIRSEPDRSVEFFTLGPRILVSTMTFDKTGLARQGSLFRTHYQVRCAPDAGSDTAEAVAGQIRAAFPEAGWRVRDYARAAPHIRTVLERLRVDLTLVGLAALLLGGLGIAGGVRGYLEARLPHIAAMKCMGGSVSVLCAAYMLQILALSLLGGCAGLGTGALTPWIADRFFPELLPVHVVSGVYAAPLVQAGLFGLMTTLTFALPPLLRALTVRPSAIFRGYVHSDQTSMPTMALVPIILCWLVLAGMVFLFAGTPRLAAWFVTGTGAAFLLLSGVARVVCWLAGRIPPLPWASLRIGLTNIHRPGSPGVRLVFALGFGLTALVAVSMVNLSLTRALTTELSTQAPAFFFMDIRSHEVDAFRALVLETPGVDRLDLRPMVRGRIVRIGDVAVENATVSEDVEWAVRGDRGLSYSQDLPPGSTLARGAWWDATYSGPPQISLTADLARGFGLDLGDTLTVNVLGRNLTGTITSIREVNWSSLAMQFAILFSPGSLERAPHTWLGAAYGVDDQRALFDRVTSAFPDVAVVTVRDALETAARLMVRTVRVFQAMALVALVVGMLVLAGAFAADQHHRIYESVLYKVCGATRRDILAILLAEFSLAGVFAGLASLALGMGAAWAVVHGLLHMHFFVDVGWAIATVMVGALVSVAVGLLGTWRALGHKAAPLLRNE
ncbi:ABC transporter permease [Desulfovibrionales bacterium]